MFSSFTSKKAPPAANGAGADGAAANLLLPVPGVAEAKEGRAPAGAGEQRVLDRAEGRPEELTTKSVRALVREEVASLSGQRVQDAASRERKESLSLMTALHSDVEMLKMNQVKIYSEQATVNDKVRDQIQRLEERVTKLEQQKERAPQDLTTKLGALTAQGNDLQQKYQECVKSVEKHDAAVNEYGRQSVELRKWATEVEKWEKGLSEASEKRIQELQSKLDDLDSRKAEAAEMQRLCDKLEHALQEQSDTHSKTIQDFGSKLTSHDRNLAQVEAQNGKLAEEQTELGKRLEERLDELDRALQDRSNKLTNHDKDLAQLSELSSAQSKQQAELQKKLQAQQDGVEDSLNRTAGVVERNNEIAKTLLDHNSRLADHDRDLTQLETKHGALSNRLGEQHDELAQKLHDHGNKLADHDRENAGRQQAVAQLSSDVEKYIHDSHANHVDNSRRIEAIQDSRKDLDKEIRELVEKIANELMEKYQHLAAAIPPRISEETQARTAAVASIQRVQSEHEAIMKQLRDLVSKRMQDRDRDLAEKDGALAEVRQQVSRNADRYEELKGAIQCEKQDRCQQGEDLRMEIMHLIKKEEQDRIVENTEQRAQVLKTLSRLHPVDGHRADSAEDGAEAAPVASGGWFSWMSGGEQVPEADKAAPPAPPAEEGGGPRPAAPGGGGD